MEYEFPPAVWILLLALVIAWVAGYILQGWWKDNHPPKFCTRCGCPLARELVFFTDYYDKYSGKGTRYREIVLRCPNWSSTYPHTSIRTDKFETTSIVSKCD